MEELFGALRSHLSAQHRDVYWRAALWALLQEAYAQDTARYQEQWVPYLSAQTFWQEAPLARFHDVKKYRAACKVAPFATFFLYFGEFLDDMDRERGYALWGQGVSFEDAPTEFRALGQLHSLNFSVSGEIELWLSDEMGTQTFYLAERLMSWSRFADVGKLKALSFGEEAQLDAGRWHVLEKVRASVFCALEQLELYYGDGARALRALDAQLIGQLRELRVISSAAGDAQTWREVSQRASLRSLERLALPACEVVDESVQLIARAAPQLKALDLSSNQALSAEGLEALSPMLSTLEDLDLTGIEVEEALGALLSNERLHDVTQLHVTVVSQQEAYERSEGRCAKLIPVSPKGRTLTLRVDFTDGQRWVELLTAPGLAFTLTGLSLGKVNISQLEALLDHERFSGLRELELALPEDASLHEAYVACLAQHAQPWSVLSLCTDRCALSPEAMALLTRHERFAQMTGLGVKLEPGRQAVELKPWSRLERLRLDAYASQELASLLVDELYGLKWLGVMAEGEARQRLSRVPRIVDGMRAAGYGAWCDYPWRTR